MPLGINLRKPYKNLFAKLATFSSIALRLSTKMLVLSGVVIAGFSVIAVLGSLLLRDVRIGGKAYVSIRNYQASLEKIAYLKSDFNQIRVEYLSVADENNRERRKQRLEVISALNRKVDQSFAEILALTPEKHHKPLNDAKDEWKVFTDNMSGKIIPVILAGNRELAFERLQSIQKYRYERFVANLDTLIISLDKLSDEAERSAENMVHERMTAMMYTSGMILLLVLVLVLIVTLEFKTEKERAEQYLRIAEVVLLAINESGTITLLNRKGHEVLGYQDGELIGKEWFKACIPAEEFGTVSTMYKKMMAEDTGKLEFLEYTVLGKNGERRLMAWHNVVMKDANGRFTGVLSSGEDITERTAAEVERLKMQFLLNQAQKMETVGRLAGGIAHDFNNKLTVILGYAQLLDMEGCQKNQHCMDYIREILRAGQHAQEITRRLLTFSRSEEVSPIKLDLNLALKEIKKTLGRMIGEHVTLKVELQSDLWPVRIDPTQFDQVITNIVVNARDVMPDGGTITISTSNRTVTQDYDEVPQGNYVHVSCVDTGCGMDPEVLDHIFEPFFTTKVVGKGTGLGLSSVYGIVRQNKGYITVQSKRGEGSAFSIFLPCYTDNSQVDSLTETAVESGGFGNILLVEDEEPVRIMTKLMLETLGYVVIAAGSPTDALELCKDPLNVIDCVLSDVIMPEIDGKVLKSLIVNIRPDLPFIFMSGYTADVINSRLESVEDFKFISKPLDFRVLNQKIQQLVPTAEIRTS
jgi:PAS domain S-box-containing protein